MTNSKQTQDQQIKALYETVKQKRALVEAAEAKPSWKTNCLFRFEPDQNSKAFNIMTCDKETLILIAGTLIEKEAAYNKGTEALGVKKTFTWGNYSLDDWMADLKLRMTKLELTTRKAELETLEKRLNRILPEDLRVQLEIEEILKSEALQD